MNLIIQGDFVLKGALDMVELIESPIGCLHYGKKYICLELKVKLNYI